MTIPTHLKSYPLTGYIKITRQGASESGEPFVRLRSMFSAATCCSCPPSSRGSLPPAVSPSCP